MPEQGQIVTIKTLPQAIALLDQWTAYAKRRDVQLADALGEIENLKMLLRVADMVARNP